MTETTEAMAEDAIQELFNQYQTLKETLGQIRGGSSLLKHTFTGSGIY